MNDKQIVVFLMGPTASGKTNLAIKLAKYFDIRIISTDSAMIYQGMDIGTAKPSKKILKQFPHYLIDIRTPAQPYSVNNFIEDAQRQIQIAFQNQQIPVLVGGSSFYFNALEFGLSSLPQSTRESREKFNQLLKENGVIFLHKQLEQIDPVVANKIHQNDAQRITRALEVHYLSGKTLSKLQGKKQLTLHYPIKKIVLMPNRDELHQKIEKRFLSMLEHGFIQEARKLYQNPNLSANLPSMRCVGYRQAWQYFEGKISKDEMTEKAIIATRQLCKRQTTWLHRQKNALVQKQVNIQQIVQFINSDDIIESFF